MSFFKQDTGHNSAPYCLRFNMQVTHRRMSEGVLRENAHLVKECALGGEGGTSVSSRYWQWP